MAHTARSMQPVLTGTLVELRPLRQEDREALLAAAMDGELWNHKLTVIPGPDTIDAYLARALSMRDAGNTMPYVIVQKSSGRVVGTTRFWKIDPANRKLEIGHTWLARSAQGSGVNTEAKFLLLSYAFEVMNCVRVQFTTDELNTRSRAAILGLGAVQEGVVRNERIMPDGRIRNSVRFSIVDVEWPVVKRRLQDKLHGGPDSVMSEEDAAGL